MSKEGGRDGGDQITITVKFVGRSIPLSMSGDSTIKDLKHLLQPLTNVLPRGQKLIFKGKLLVDAMTLKESELTNGAKVMLMASQGLHQGSGPILKEAQTRHISRTTNNDSENTNEKMKLEVERNRLGRWKLTGVIALCEHNLKAIPEEVWDCGSSVRVLDLRNNFIDGIPVKIGCLNSIQKLLLNANGLSDGSVHWEGLTTLKHLSVLSICNNNLTTLPSALGALTSLRQLHLANNQLTELPIEMGLLTQLEVLKVNSNRIVKVPDCIGDANALIEVDLSSNLLTSLPETFGNLMNLKALYLRNNALKGLPFALFKNCIQLSILDLHNTEITIDVLREFEGWEGFDERRRSKHQKQLDFRVSSSTKFDEGADKE